MSLFNGRQLFFMSVLLYVAGFPVAGALVGYACYGIAAAIGLPVNAEHLYLLVGVWVLFFAFGGLIGLRSLLRIEAVRKSAESREENRSGS
jgi:hypothetical protein